MVRLIPLTLFLLLFGACAQGPRDISIGAEECAHCRMIVSEEAFATQLRTAQGRVHVFDSIECMAEYVQADDGPDVQGMWVTDFNAPGSWIAAVEARYLQSEQLRSPMGMNLSAYARLSDAEAQREQFEGEVLTWDEVLALVARVGVSGGGGNHAH